MLLKLISLFSGFQPRFRVAWATNKTKKGVKDFGQCILVVPSPKIVQFTIALCL